MAFLVTFCVGAFEIDRQTEREIERDRQTVRERKRERIISFSLPLTN